jgi:hypothetical protein
MEDIIITKEGPVIKINCTSYVLINQGEQIYGMITSCIERHMPDIDCLYIHEHVLDIVLNFLEQKTNMKFQDRNYLRFFGIPVKTFKRCPTELI